MQGLNPIASMSPSVDNLAEGHENSAMELLVVILKDYRKVESVLLGFVELDVTGATVLEGQGMGQLLGDVPIMVDLKGLFPGSANDSYVILAAMSAGQITQCMGLVESVCGTMDAPSAGIMFTVPIGAVRGMKPAID